MTWRKVLDYDTPAADVPYIIAEHIELARDDLRARLAADADLDDQTRAQLLAEAEPHIAKRTRETIENAWLSLQSTHRHGALMREEPCRVVLADPPWFFGDRLPGPGRGAAKVASAAEAAAQRHHAKK